MFASLENTWGLTKQSFAVLRADKEILLFPVMSAAAAILVTLTFFIPLLLTGALQSSGEARGSVANLVVLFAFYYANYFVIVFFNSAMVACASIRLSGGAPTVGDGLRVARSRLGRIALWALVASTVGLLLRLLEERARKLSRLVIALLGATWTLLTYFMIPVLVFEDLTIGDSLRRSAELFRRNWGEEVVSGFSFGLLFFLLAIPGFLLGFLGFAVHPVAGVAVLALYFLVLAAVASAVKGIFVVALYRYATQGEVPSAFSPHLVQGAFAPRESRW